MSDARHDGVLTKGIDKKHVALCRAPNLFFIHLEMKINQHETPVDIKTRQTRSWHDTNLDVRGKGIIPEAKAA